MDSPPCRLREAQDFYLKRALTRRWSYQAGEKHLSTISVHKSREFVDFIIPLNYVKIDREMFTWHWFAF